MIEAASATETAFPSVSSASTSDALVYVDFVRLFLGYWKSSLLGLGFIIISIAVVGSINLPKEHWTL